MFKYVGLGLTILGAIMALVAGFAFQSIPWAIAGGVIFGIGLYAMSKG